MSGMTGLRHGCGVTRPHVSSAQPGVRRSNALGPEVGAHLDTSGGVHTAHAGASCHPPTRRLSRMYVDTGRRGCGTLQLPKLSKRVYPFRQVLGASFSVGDNDRGESSAVKCQTERRPFLP